MDVAFCEAFAAKRFEAASCCACWWSLWSGWHNSWVCERSVTIHSNDMIWCPACRTTAATADKLECHTKRLWTSDLWTLVFIGLALKSRSTAVRVCHRFNRTRPNKLRSLRMLVELATRHALGKFFTRWWR